MKYLSIATHRKLTHLQNSIDDIIFDRNTADNCKELDYVNLTNPSVKFTEDAKAGEYDGLSDEEYNLVWQQVSNESKNLWKNCGYIETNYRKLHLELIRALTQVNDILDKLLRLDNTTERQEKERKELEKQMKEVRKKMLSEQNTDKKPRPDVFISAE